MLKLSLFEDEQNTPFLCVPLNANELLLPAQRAELQQPMSFYLTQIYWTFQKPFMFKDKDGEAQEEVTPTGRFW